MSYETVEIILNKNKGRTFSISVPVVIIENPDGYKFSFSFPNMNTFEFTDVEMEISKMHKCILRISVYPSDIELIPYSSHIFYSESRNGRYTSTLICIGDILYIHENECMDLTINYSVKQGIYMYESTLTMHFKGVKHL